MKSCRYGSLFRDQIGDCCTCGVIRYQKFLHIRMLESIAVLGNFGTTCFQNSTVVTNHDTESTNTNGCSDEPVRKSLVFRALTRPSSCLPRVSAHFSERRTRPLMETPAAPTMEERARLAGTKRRAAEVKAARASVKSLNILGGSGSESLFGRAATSFRLCGPQAFPFITNQSVSCLRCH